MIPTSNLTIQSLQSDEIKLALAGNQHKGSLRKQKHGIDSREYRQLQTKIWTSGHYTDLIPLWEEDLRYLDASIQQVLNNDQDLIELVSAIHHCQNASVRDHFISCLEKERSLFCRIIQKLGEQHPHPSLQNALNMVSRSEILSKDIIATMYALGSRLPRSISGLKLGVLTIEERLLALKENPVELRHKVLHALQIRPDGHKIIGEKELGLILGDAYISQSGLEGYNFAEAFELVGCFHEALTPEICRELEAMKRYAKLLSLAPENQVSVFEDLAKELQQGGRIALPCGWITPTGGHAMVAECRLEKNGTATLRLYNQGAGISYHNMQTADFRERRGAWLEKRDIPQHLVLSPAFWMILLGLMCPQSFTGTEPYSDDDLYSWFIHCIPGTLYDGEKLILPQRSGTCAIAAILAYLNGNLTEAAYDNFILKFKCGTTVRYEEDLFLRRGIIGQTEKCFLQEICHKLGNSVKTQAKVGRISEELKELLLLYCNKEVALSEESSQAPTVCQLRSRFSLEPSGYKIYAADSWTTGHNRYGIDRVPRASYYKTGASLNSILASLPPNLAHINSLDAMELVQNFLEQMPPLSSVRDLDLSQLHKVIYQVAEHKASLPGLPNQLIVAWLTEAYTLLVERELSAIVPAICLSPVPGSHPLEKEDCILNRRLLLSPLGERLLQEWRARRYEQRETKRFCTTHFFKTGTVAFLFDPEKFRQFATHYGDLKWILRDSVTNLVSIRCELEVGITKTGIEQLPKKPNVLLPCRTATKSPKFAYKNCDAQTATTLPTLPFIGIDQQLFAMEEDIEKIALFKPEESWLALSFTNSSGLELKDSPTLGISPLTALIGLPYAQEVYSRIKRLTQRLLHEHPDRQELAISLLKLVSEINLRVAPQAAICLTLPQDYPQALDVAVSYYLLTLPLERISATDRLYGYYLAKIIIGLTQEPSILQTVLNKIDCVELEKKLEEGGKSEWERACTRYKTEGVEIKKDGIPYANNIMQINFESAYQKMLLALFAELKFGLWHLKNDSGQPMIVRKYECPKSGGLVLNFFDPLDHRYAKGQDYLLVNKTVLKLRLLQLGLELPDHLQHDGLYRVCRTQVIKSLPADLYKDHLEFWCPEGETESTTGLIIDPEQRITYLAESNGKSFKIINLATQAELLHGFIKSRPGSLITWHGTQVQIPYIGQIVQSQDNMLDIEVWAKGHKKNFELWLSAMHGAVRFYVTPGRDGQLRYASQDYSGFCWNPKDRCQELGMLNGILLTKDAEELLIIPQQHLEDGQSQPYRKTWISNHKAKPIIFKRTLHPDLKRDDPNQRLFVTKELKDISYLIRELMYSRDWERAKRYVGLIMPASGKNREFAKIVSSLLLQPITLSHPKAQVLFLRILATAQATLSLNDASQLAFCTQTYHKYIDQYHHLDHGWALSCEEEMRLSCWCDPQKENEHIQGHLRRVSAEETSAPSSYKPANTAIAAHGNTITQGPPDKSLRLVQLYRPRTSFAYINLLIKQLSEPWQADECLLKAAYIWYALRGHTMQLSYAAHLRQSLVKSTPGKAELWKAFGQIYNVYQYHGAIEQLLPPSGASTTIAQNSIVPTQTLRQKERHNRLAARVIPASDLPHYVAGHIHSVLAKCKLEHTGRSQRLFSSLEALFSEPELLLQELQRLLEQTEAIHAVQIEQIAPLFLPGKIGLRELFDWLESASLKEDTAERLIKIAQTRGELCMLKQAVEALKINPHLTKKTLRRMLAIASIVDEDIDLSLRSKLASFMWKKELALRPNQLDIILHTQRVRGLLAQVDCGEGKTFVIGPGISAISNNLVVNVVPHGVVEAHAAQLSRSLESTNGTLAFPLTLSRQDIWEKLAIFEEWTKAAKKAHTPIITTVSDLASFVLGYFELRLAPADSPLQKHRERIESLREFFGTQATLLLDEVDASAKEQVHWTMGERLSIANERIEIIGTIYEAIMEIDSQNGGSLFCLDGNMRFSSERYHKETIHTLARYLIEKNRFPKVENLNQEWLLKYLTADRGTFQTELPQEHREFLEMLRAELKVYLPHTLAMRYKVAYGPGPDDSVGVVPYKAARAPDPKSRYTYFEIIANLTLQMAYRDIPQSEMVRVAVAKLLHTSPDKAIYYAKRWLGPAGTLADFRSIVEKKNGWLKLIDQIQQNRVARLDIALSELLPYIELYTQIMQFSVASLEQTFGHIVGLTATPYNHAGMDERLAENFKPTDAYETTRKKLSTCPIQTYSQIDDATLSQVASRANVHALMDPSAWLVDYPNQQVAERILSGARHSIEHVVFWDIATSSWHVLGRRGLIESYDSSKHTSSKTFIYFDQQRSRGMDMPLPDECIAIVLVGHDCTFTGLKQASERLRQFKIGKQRVELWVESQSAHCDVLKMVDKNELRLLVEELPLMAKRQMFELCRKKLLIASKKDSTCKKALKDLLLQQVDHYEYRKHASLEAAPTVRQELDNYFYELITKCDFHDAADVTALERIKTRCLDALKEAADSIYEPSLDIRAEVIHIEAYEQERRTDVDLKAEAHSQQKVTSQVETDNELQKHAKGRLFDAKELLLSLANPIARDQQELAVGTFSASRLTDLFQRLVCPKAIWLPTTMLPMPKMTEAELNLSPMKRELWKRVAKCAYILRFHDNVLLLQDREANLIAKELRLNNYPDRELVRLDGTSVNTAQSTLSPEILQAVALFNASLGPLRTHTFDPANAASRLAFLKDRLAHYSESDPNHYLNNPIVQQVAKI